MRDVSSDLKKREDKMAAWTEAGEKPEVNWTRVPRLVKQEVVASKNYIKGYCKVINVDVEPEQVGNEEISAFMAKAEAKSLKDLYVALQAKMKETEVILITSLVLHWILSKIMKSNITNQNCCSYN